MSEKMPCSISDGPDTPCDQADEEREPMELSDEAVADFRDVVMGFERELDAHGIGIDDDDCGCPDDAEEKCVNILCPRK